MSDDVTAKVVEVDPHAAAIAAAVGKHNCRATLHMNKERIAHFLSRIRDLQLSPCDVVIVVINVDDSYSNLAHILMPDHDWQAYRDRGEVPFARGLVMRDGIQKLLDETDKEAAAKLADHALNAVVVFDHGVAEVFPL